MCKHAYKVLGKKIRGLQGLKHFRKKTLKRVTIFYKTFVSSRDATLTHEVSDNYFGAMLNLKRIQDNK